MINNINKEKLSFAKTIVIIIMYELEKKIHQQILDNTTEELEKDEELWTINGQNPTSYIKQRFLLQMLNTFLWAVR